MTFKYVRYALPAAMTLLVTTSASAHIGHDTPTFSSGLGHPFGGWDHLLAMVVVGLLAARHGGRWRWALPVGFLSGLTLGGLLSTLHVGLPAVELSIAASVLVLGVLLSLGTNVSPMVLLGVITIAAVPHGHAHLSEAGHGSMLGYGIGMLLGSTLLHAIGILVGSWISSLSTKTLIRTSWHRVAGAAFACVGIVLTAGVVIGF